MNKINIGNKNLYASRIIHGCMRLAGHSLSDADKLINTAVDLGIDYFDHADTYAAGESEILFGNVLKNNAGLRDKIKLQTKCGIVRDPTSNVITHFDFSKEHIINSVNGSLKRLGVDHIDTLLLHRPDTLMEPEDVAAAFDELQSSGKVSYFGVSNQNPLQIDFLKTYVTQPLIINQLQLSILECSMIGQGLNTNMSNKLSFMHDGGVLEYSRINDVTIQAWSPFQIGFFEGTFLDNPEYPELNAVLAKYAEKYNCSKSAIAVAWILRHPAKMQVIAGTCNPVHLKEIAKADEIELSRFEWYDIYKSAGHSLP